MSAAKDDLVVLELDAPHVGVAHRVERLVHEVDDRGEHRCDEIRIRAGREAAGEVHHRDASPVDEEDVVHDGADPGHGYGDLRPEGRAADEGPGGSPGWRCLRGASSLPASRWVPGSALGRPRILMLPASSHWDIRSTRASGPRS